MNAHFGDGTADFRSVTDLKVGAGCRKQVWAGWFAALSLTLPSLRCVSGQTPTRSTQCSRVTPLHFKRHSIRLKEPVPDDVVTGMLSQ